MKTKALDFIWHERYSTIDVMMEVLRVDKETTQQVLAELVREKLINYRIIPFASTHFEIYTIRKEGALGRPYKPFKKLSVIRMEHTLAGQRIRANINWLAWESEHWFSSRWPIQPDALAVTTSGDENILCAIEVEHNRKNPKRYRGVILRHLDNIRFRRYQYVMYFCPNTVQVETLRGVFENFGLELNIDINGYFGFFPYPAVRRL